MTKTPIYVVLATIGALSVSACGNSVGDRALSGGAIGAGAGAIGGLMFGSPAVGAAVGGALGAAAGAATDNNQVNLGKPVWRQ